MIKFKTRLPKTYKLVTHIDHMNRLRMVFAPGDCKIRVLQIEVSAKCTRQQQIVRSDQFRGIVTDLFFLHSFYCEIC